MRVLLRLALLCFALVSVPVMGQVASRAVGPSVTLNGRPILTLRSGHNESRAKIVAASLAKLTPDSNLVLKPVSKAKFAAVQLMDGKRVVLTASIQEAKSQKMLPLGLAQLWLARIRAALLVPPLSLSDDTVRLAVGMTKRVTIEGYLAAKALAKTDNTAIQSMKRQGNDLILTGKTEGSSVISLHVGKETKFLAVKVMPYAMKSGQSFSVSVVGDPSDSETVRGAVETALWTRIQVAPNAQYKFAMPNINALSSGQGATYTVGVDATAPNCVDFSGPVTVKVTNEGLASRKENALWYCNDPENVKAVQNLFAARLTSTAPVRMLYHHMNASAVPLYIEVGVMNESDETAHVLILPGDAKPNPDPVKVGLLAGDMFLRALVSNSGEIVSIPPRTSVPVALRRLAPGETMSGLCQLRLVSGPKSLLVRADSKAVYDFDGRLQSALESGTPWRRIPPRPLGYTGRAKVELSAHIYPAPFKNEEITYELGGRYGFIRLGQKPIPRADGKGLDGNFGVIYSIDATLKNPLDEPAEVEVVFEASAGYSGAVFVVDGQIKRLPLVMSKEESPILKVRLDAGEQRTINLKTIPLSGSSYPATVVIRPANPGQVAGKKGQSP